MCPKRVIVCRWLRELWLGGQRHGRQVFLSRNSQTGVGLAEPEEAFGNPTGNMLGTPVSPDPRTAGFGKRWYLHHANTSQVFRLFV